MQISADGLIHLSIEELLSLPISHLVSGLDMDEGPHMQICGNATSLSGYTEWRSHKAPCISIGWDWCFNSLDAGISWKRVGLPRSNMLLITDAGIISWRQNLEILATVADSLPWREHVLQAITSHYS